MSLLYTYLHNMSRCRQAPAIVVDEHSRSLKAFSPSLTAPLDVVVAFHAAAAHECLGDCPLLPPVFLHPALVLPSSSSSSQLPVHWFSASLPAFRSVLLLVGMHFSHTSKLFDVLRPNELTREVVFDSMLGLLLVNTIHVWSFLKG